MQNWKFLMELECEKELAKLDSWNRGKARDSTFVAPYVSPPKELVIQGLLPAPPSKPAPKREKCRECFHYDRRNSQCRIKREMGLVMKGYCPKRFSKYNFSVDLRRSDEELCLYCDFYDKVKRNCLIKRVNGEGCIYIRKVAKAVLPNLSNGRCKTVSETRFKQLKNPFLNPHALREWWLNGRYIT